MVEVIENLIVKVSQHLPVENERRISGESIKLWKQYTYQYFQHSPNAFLVENDYYNMLSANMKIKIVKENLMTRF